MFEGELRYVWNSLRYLGVRQDDLADVAHDVFLQVIRHLDQYDEERALRPWLFAFAYHAASNHRRLSRHQREVSGEGLEHTDDRSPVDEQVAAREELSLVQEALLDLPLERRAVLVMHEMDEVPIPGVAEALGIPLNTAYSRLRVARQEFRDAVTRRKSGGAS